MEEVPKMDAARLLRELDGLITAEPILGELTAIHLAYQFLQGTREAVNGGVSAAIETIRIDLDKVQMLDAGPRIHEWILCYEGYQALFPLVRKINGGRGSRTLDAIVAAFARWSRADAKVIWRNDGDKLSQYPGVVSMVYYDARLGCRVHGRVYCPRCPSPASYLE